MCLILYTVMQISEYLVTISEFTELSLIIVAVYNNDLVLLTFDVGCHIKLTRMSGCLLWSETCWCE